MVNCLKNLVINYGIWAISLIFCIEGLGTPFPTQVGFIGAVGFIISNRYSILFFILVITLSNLIGNIIIYFLLGFGSKNIINFFERLFKIKKEYLFDISKFFSKYGFFTISVARIIGIPRTLVIFLAGVTKMSFLTYITSALIGNLIWSTFYIYFFMYGYKFGKYLYDKNLQLFVVAILILLCIIIILWLVLIKIVLKKKRRV
ncbi:DedA family protein [Caldicellulosiruptoraceae bacterium PP1]